jgi:DNA repair protein RadC
VLAGGPPADEPPVARAAQAGADGLASAELLALVLARGATPSVRAVARAGRVVAAFGDVARLAVATPGELAFRGRLTLPEAVRVAAAFALGRRGLERPWARGAPVRSAADVVDRYVARMRHLRHERFLTVLVDAKNRVLREDVVGDGGLSSVGVHPREAFGPALREGASGVVFVHNHPSGDPEPSPVDDDLTRRLLAVGELLGIRVLDHIVIGDGRFVSYRDRGLVPPA